MHVLRGYSHVTRKYPPTTLICNCTCSASTLPRLLILSALNSMQTTFCANPGLYRCMRQQQFIVRYFVTVYTRFHINSAVLRAKNSYSIERRLMDYVPTATLWSCYGRVPSQCKSCKLKQSELKLNL
jgi:hypothetical protein